MLMWIFTAFYKFQLKIFNRWQCGHVLQIKLLLTILLITEKKEITTKSIVYNLNNIYAMYVVTNVFF